ncbi:hypothetical protein ACQKWADRAFT_295793 [Trichoderma austrokoningii]
MPSYIYSIYAVINLINMLPSIQHISRNLHHQTISCANILVILSTIQAIHLHRHNQSVRRRRRHPISAVGISVMVFAYYQGVRPVSMKKKITYGDRSYRTTGRSQSRT